MVNVSPWDCLWKILMFISLHKLLCAIFKSLMCANTDDPSLFWSTLREKSLVHVKQLPSVPNSHTEHLICWSETWNGLSCTWQSNKTRPCVKGSQCSQLALSVWSDQIYIHWAIKALLLHLIPQSADPKWAWCWAVAPYSLQDSQPPPHHSQNSRGCSGNLNGIETFFISIRLEVVSGEGGSKPSDIPWGNRDKN